MEFISGVHSTTEALFAELTAIHSATSQAIGDELLWCQSMPAILPKDSEIPLADYGESNVGRLKTLYRRGLGLRYGRSMQSIAGVHYNFSLTDNFWNHLKNLEGSNEPLQEFKNTKYFHLIRNYKRYSWLLVYLFGASPVVDESFLEGKEHNLEKLTNDTFYSPEAIALRMGGLGYTSKAQEDIQICYNQLSTYIKTLENARKTPYPAYSKIGLKNSDGEHLQLNDHLLQIDNEFYSNIRPKNIARTRESALGALYHRGVEYIEVRILDVNPFDPLGIDKDQVNFLHLFLLWCLTSESPKLGTEECDRLEENLDLIVRYGRKDGLELMEGNSKVSRDEYLKKIMDSIAEFSSPIFEIDKDYKVAFENQMAKIENKDLLIVNKVLSESNRGFIKSSLSHSLAFHEEFLQTPIPENYDFNHLAAASVHVEELERTNDKRSFDEFLKFYFEEIKLPV